MSESEKRMWSGLRGKKLGFVVRRQYPAGPYFMDFYIPAAKLCIEVDGEQHFARKEHDHERDEYLANLGILTVRVPSWELIEKLDPTLDWIFRHCCERAGFNPFETRRP
ncbi:MAG: DUF559 domain-containing protein [Fimbriimonas ginsengisoli]|uniref:DUF559 domain-containing protein n=1 Tax=Fimbriimonas ginsengisoli TaxID=1005039 RepID=A0A931LWK9_FIMGI|nr:DUF559 domain-containing protein [Fimbriimonas ginsengisoli]MBI3722268.1 DUF559 domain-containing protein [Fimbriimonas ginsengisoli]